MSPEEFLLSNPSFTTKMFASHTRLRMESATRSLKRYTNLGLITKITRGVWANTKHPYFSAYGLVPLLLESEQGYVSFLSALHRHGVISQIPQKILVATTGHTRKLNTPVAYYEFIKVSPRYHQFGVEWFSGKSNYSLATAEKALLDCLYLSTRKGRRFLKFPELDFQNFTKKKFKFLLQKHQFPLPIALKIQEQFEELWNNSL